MSKTNKAIKCRIYPNTEQQILIAKTLDCSPNDVFEFVNEESEG